MFKIEQIPLGITREFLYMRYIIIIHSTASLLISNHNLRTLFCLAPITCADLVKFRQAEILCLTEFMFVRPDNFSAKINT